MSALSPRAKVAAIVVGVALGGTLGVGSAELVATEPARSSAVLAVTSDPAAGVVVAPDGPSTGYDREARFGGWAAAGRGCDVRDRVLARDLTGDVVRGECDVVAGRLVEPYTGVVVVGPTRALDVDHVVPLALAWRTGAARWSDGARRAFANDLGELVTTTAHENRSRGDDGPEEWLPARDRCGFVRHFGAVLRRYALTATAERVAAMRQACRR